MLAEMQGSSYVSRSTGGMCMEHAFIEHVSSKHAAIWRTLKEDIHQAQKVLNALRRLPIHQFQAKSAPVPDSEFFILLFAQTPVQMI